MSVFVDQALKVTLFCKDENGDPVDLSTEAANIKFLSRDPAGAEVTYVPVIEDTTGGEISYTFPIDILTVGRWWVKGYLFAQQVPGTRFSFLVEERWDA